MSEKVTPLARDGWSNRGGWWHSRFFLLLAPERNSSCVLDQEQPSLHCRMHPSRVLEDFSGGYANADDFNSIALQILNFHCSFF